MFPFPTDSRIRTLPAGLFLLLNLLVSVPAPAVEVSGLPLEQARALAQAYSPELAAADLDRDAASARRDQAGRRPNPSLNLDWENLAGSGTLAGVGASEWVLSMSQVFDLSGRRTAARDLHAGGIALLEQDRLSALLDLRLDVETAFGEVWFAQEVVALAEEQSEVARELQAELAARLAAGGSSLIESTRARAGVAAAEISLIQAREKLGIARRTLAAFWGDGDPDFPNVILPSGFWSRAAARFDPGAIAANPDLARWRSARDFQAARLELARAEAGTDLELALGVKLENLTGDRAFVLGGSLPLPIHDRNQGELRALDYERESLGRLEEGAVNTLLTRLATAVESQTGARRELDIMAAEIIPLARQAYAETRTAHQRGLYGLTDVLETRRNLYALRQVELETQLRFYTATVRIARLTGRDILDMQSASLEVEQ